jgi:hypothetical protein
MVRLASASSVSRGAVAEKSKSNSKASGTSILPGEIRASQYAPPRMGAAIVKRVEAVGVNLTLPQ